MSTGPREALRLGERSFGGTLEHSVYFSENQTRFSLTRAGDLPLRHAQLGALHALGAHFSLSAEPAIVALPTGVGKSAVGAAAPFVIADPGRTLYVVPSKVLRADVARNLAGQHQLRACGLLTEDIPDPRVLEVDSKPGSWDAIERADAVVALPNSLYELIERDPLPRDLFDIIVFDEAHHVPARTWTLVASAFDCRQVLLTATPYRRDARELPGDVVYSYPLSKAIADQAYAPVHLLGVETIGLSENEADRVIAAAAAGVLRGGAHAGTSSRLLVRAATKNRAAELVGVYAELGLTINLVHSGLTPSTVDRRIAAVRSGDVDGIAFVGILGEGFDCPELKVGAYHDKHRSLPVTLQFLGRLSRVCASAGPPQVVSAVETLRGDTWALWRRDADWSQLIPELAETVTDDVKRRKALLGKMDEFPRSDVALNDIRLRPSLGLYEVRVLNPEQDDEQVGVDFGMDVAGVEATGVVTGGNFAGGTIVWSHLSTDEQFLMFVTSHRERPDWLRSDALDSERFEMHLVLVRKGPDGIPIVAVSSITRNREQDLMERLAGSVEAFRLASPDFMRRFLTVANIANIQHLGTRNTAGGSQARTYTTNTGSAVEDGLAYDDLRDDVVGHVGATCHIEGQDYNGGVSITNSRLWVIKNFPIDGYIDFVDGVLRDMGAGQPGEIRRLAARFESSLTAWPESEPIVVIFDQYFFTSVASIAGVPAVDVPAVAAHRDDGLLELCLPSLDWSARLRTNGTIADSSGPVDIETEVGTADLVQLLLEYPPTIYYRDGTSTRGGRLIPPGAGVARPPLHEILNREWDWSTTNIEHETPRPNRTDSIHETVESVLCDSNPAAWIIGDDGSGEIADHIMIKADGDHVDVHLFHSKKSSEPEAGVRTHDLDELVAQIVRSKRWVALADRSFWERLAARVVNRASTRLIHGPHNADLHDLRNQFREWSETPPIVTSHYVGVQPGLAVDVVLERFDRDDGASAGRVAETIGACAAWVGSANATLTIIGNSG